MVYESRAYQTFNPPRPEGAQEHRSLQTKWLRVESPVRRCLSSNASRSLTPALHEKTRTTNTHLFWILRAASCLLQGQLLPADLRPTGFHQAPLPGERCLDGRLHVAPMRVSPATRQRLGGEQGEDVSHGSVQVLGIGDQELLFNDASSDSNIVGLIPGLMLNRTPVDFTSPWRL